MNTEWISLKDKEPEAGQKCLVYCTDGNIVVTQRGTKNFVFPCWVFIHAPMYCQLVGDNVTHWIPLPEPPKEQSNV